MFGVIFQSSLIYWATALDLLIILTVLFCNFPQKKSQIIWGQILGSLGLLLVSLIFALILGVVPNQWLLGFLGLIPIGFGLRYLIKGDDDEEELKEKLEQRKGKSLLITVSLISFASCGADNIGLFTPFFISLKSNQIVLATVTFVLNILLLGVLGQFIAKIPHLHEILEKYSRWVLGAVFIGIGVMVLFEAGTIARLLELF